MKTIMKKDLLLHQSAFLVILLLIPFTYIVNIYPIPPVIGGFYGYFIGLFYYDQKVNANQFLVSLPITRATIINARYVFTILTFLGLLVYWYLIDFIAHNVLPYLSFEPMPFQVYIVIFLLALNFAAIYLPVYIAFSYLVAFIIQIVSITAVPALLVTIGRKISLDAKIFQWMEKPLLIFEAMNSFQQFIVFCFITISLLFLSWLISQWIFARKDLA